MVTTDYGRVKDSDQPAGIASKVGVLLFPKLDFLTKTADGTLFVVPVLILLDAMSFKEGVAIVYRTGMAKLHVLHILTKRASLQLYVDHVHT
jgi:hypothetical protein